MSCKTKSYFNTLLIALTVFGCLTSQPGIAGESIVIGGSGNALGTMRLLGAAYGESDSGGKIIVLPSLGSSGGIKAVAKGAIDIGVSVRPLTASEKVGLNSIEFAQSPLVVAVRSDNPLSSMSKEEFIKIVRGKFRIGEKGLRARAILRPLHDAEIVLIGKAFPEIAEAIAQEMSARKDVTIALTAQESANLIEKIPGAVGFSTLNLIRSENRHVKVLPFEGIAPSAENIANGTYPLVMKFYLVTRANPPARIRRFLQFVRSERAQQLLKESGNFDVGQGK